MLQGFARFMVDTGFAQVSVISCGGGAHPPYLAVAGEFEPLLLVPIAFGALIANLPTWAWSIPP